MPPNINDAVNAPDIHDVFEPPGPQTLQFRHRTVSGVSAEADNVMYPYYWTRLNHPALNNRPQAIVTVTPVGRIELSGPTANLVQNPHPVGVLYRDVDDRWYIYNLGLEAMSMRADFHVAIHEATREE
jgi:hypothetical protein